MKKRMICALLCVLLVASVLSACSGSAPDFTVVDAREQPLMLSEQKGKPVVVNFWATWCSPCVYELPHFAEAYNTYYEDVTFLMINVDGEGYADIPKALSFLEANGYSFPVYFDLSYEASNAYGVTSIPMTLWIDAEGRLVHSRIGMIDEEYLEHYIQEILK